MPSAISSNAPTAIWHAQNYYDENAERISNIIDEGLKQESLKRKEDREHEVRVLLLGQAESGKSTLQKQFQLFYASQTLERERPSWQAAVYLNTIRAVRAIFDSLEYAASVTGLPDSSKSDEANREIANLRTKLQPLLAAESSISFELSGGLSGRVSMYVRTGWQTLIAPQRSSSDPSSLSDTNLFHITLCAAKDSIKELWHHSLVTGLYELRKLSIEDSAPFFLNDLSRISESDYIPTTEDILNVRMRTLGVVEHSLSVQHGGENYTWRMYDVGGARGQRHAWVPYFDDATAIIFLAPISAFDQQLEEDTRTNRIEDSLQLFTNICSSQLLKKASLILLLNKVDLLQKKLQNGRKVKKYIPSYGNRKNAYEEVSQYFRAHFMQVHHKHDTAHRALFTHFTSMLDTKATHLVIVDVGNCIIRKHMAELGLT